MSETQDFEKLVNDFERAVIILRIEMQDPNGEYENEKAAWAAEHNARAALLSAYEAKGAFTLPTTTEANRVVDGLLRDQYTRERVKGATNDSL